MTRQVTIAIIVGLTLAIASAGKRLQDPANGQQVLSQLQEPENASELFFPDICPAESTSVCNRMLQPGCACYDDGICEYVSGGNRCTYCSKDNVLSFNAGQQCPQLDDAKLYVCEKHEEPIVCPRYLERGCICYSDGTCTEGMVNQCSNCQQDRVLSVVEGGKCPRLEIENQKEKLRRHLSRRPHFLRGHRQC